MIGIKDLPGSERPREKMLKLGACSLTNNELLALIINNGTKEESALTLASRVLSLDTDGIRGLLNFQPEEFTKIGGIGKAVACRICAAIELGRRIAASPTHERIKMNKPKLAAEVFMEDMRHLQSERLAIAMLNSKGDIIAREDVAMGSLYYANTSPREIFTNAVRKGAYGILLAHNHPSGDPTPSNEDIVLTKQLFAAGKLLDIHLVDHIIIGDGTYVSLKEQGVI